MTEFTPEFLKRERETLEYNNETTWSNSMSLDALDEITRLQSRIAELEEQQRWIPVSEKPEHSDRYLVRRYADVNGIRGLYISILPYNDLGGWTDSSVTHWRPLPQPPKDGE